MSVELWKSYIVPSFFKNTNPIWKILPCIYLETHVIKWFRIDSTETGLKWGIVHFENFSTRIQFDWGRWNHLVWKFDWAIFALVHCPGFYKVFQAGNDFSFRIHPIVGWFIIIDAKQSSWKIVNKKLNLNFIKKKIQFEFL